MKATAHKERDPRSCVTRSLSLGGDYLLSHFRSTIGVVRLNFSVRNGKRWDPHAIITLVYVSSLSGKRALRREAGDAKEAMTRGTVEERKNLEREPESTARRPSLSAAGAAALLDFSCTSVCTFPVLFPVLLFVSF